ncbi:DUF58 domain-containing protein [Haladaptatus sp. AB643]|uniref:DUF58 domain-containing protein n=1 Tax=Haladaptatus sp. AB643 TaxID=2934174 RepID=UPI00209C414C|nr:DUF58 domain-containing protein [Haladaptatus sp. AB643]MCO8246685.1 DUF58 domain-containing protein [Haladaptatus sp. AB643]
MHATRRHWAVVTFGLSFSALAILLDRPALVFGTVGVACWLLYQYATFTSELRRVVTETSVSQSVSRARLPTGSALTVTLAVERPDSSTLDLTVESRPPLSGRGTTAANRTVVLDADEDSGKTTYSVEFPTAGTVAFERPRLTIDDRLGLFTARCENGDEPSITVTQRTPEDVHVGRGGQRTQTQYGSQYAKRNTSGLPTVEIREYTTGDSLRRVDWNATARFDYPHVREYENETDRRLAVFIDSRPSVGNGREGETQFAYLREVALTLVSEASERSDAMALYAVGRDGVTVRHPFRSTPTHYAAIRETLYSLSVEEGENGEFAHSNADFVASRRRNRHANLQADDSQFAARIRPFLSNTGGAGSAVGVAAADPLDAAVRTQLGRHTENVHVALLTSDANRGEVENCVRYASGHTVGTRAFLAPHALFDPKGLAEIDETYSEYVSFERFRRKIGAYPRVSAFEVGPGDRIETVLSSAREVRV